MLTFDAVVDAIGQIEAKKQGEQEAAPQDQAKQPAAASN
jgi:hypothetical protein